MSFLLLAQNGGDVLRIAGDAIICLFENESMTVRSSVENAQAACLSILRLYNNYSIEGKNLQVRLYMVVGSMTMFFIGGHQGRWEYMVVGEPFMDLNKMSDLIQPGELCMSGDCWDILYSNTSRRLKTRDFTLFDLPENGFGVGVKRAKCKDSSSAGGAGGKVCVLLKLFKSERANSNRRKESVKEVLSASLFQKTIRHELVQLAMSSKAFETRLKQFVPLPVTHFCDKNTEVDLGWIEEACECSVMFVTFKGAVTGLDGLQRMFLRLQRIISENQGIIKEFSVDDKGLVLVVGFGLQPYVLSNPAVNACLSALQIKHSRTICESSNLFIGIATGNVFCSSVGSSYRSEFAVVGRIVNLAARHAYFARTSLNNKKLSSDSEAYTICVSSRTMEMAKSRINFVPNALAQGVTLKGVKGTAAIYCPIEPRYIKLLEMVNLVNSATIGRKEEMDFISSKFEATYDNLEGGLLVVKGQSGSGKTYLLQKVLKTNKRLKKLLVFNGKGTNDKMSMSLKTSVSFPCLPPPTLNPSRYLPP